MTACDYEAEFRDPHTQGQIMLTLFFAERPLSYPELAEAMNLGPRVVAGNCGELRAKRWVNRTEVEGRSRMELTVSGINAIRRTDLLA
jgi:hypothetical protein